MKDTPGPALRPIAFAAATFFWLILVAAAPGTGVAAQYSEPHRLTATGRLDLYATTRLDWRGVRRNAHPATQADAMAVAAYRAVNASAGAWTSMELDETADEPRPDLRAGAAGPTQRTLWGQLGYRKGDLSLALGVIRDWYTRAGDDPATVEAYAVVRLQAGRWSGAISVWESLDGIEGTYLEPSLVFHHFVNPFAGPAVTWASGVRSGIQIGERNPDAGPSVPGPEAAGLTHVVLDSRVRTTIHLGSGLALVAVTGPELRINRDPATRRGRDGSEADVRFWWPLQAGLSWPLRERQ